MYGLRIKQFRQKNKYSQRELGDMVGVSSRTVMRWEQNTNKPGSEEAKKIAALLGITVEELMSDEFVPEEFESDDTEQDVLDRISDGVDNLVTGQETINDVLSLSQEKDDKRHEELIGEIKNQNEAIKSTFQTYEKSLDTSKSELRHKRIRTIIVAVTCFVILIIVIATWLIWLNFGFTGKGFEGPAEMGTPSNYEIDDGI